MAENITFKKVPPAFLPNAIAIASSTGGPETVALIMAGLKGRKINIPFFITQHMPEDFTGKFAAQLSEVSGHACFEAQNGMKVNPGGIYLAHGDYHMLAVKKSGDVFIELSHGAPENFCRPSADPMLRSLATSYGGSRILAVVLTGMGKDGLAGCQMIADAGGTIIAQDKASSAVWGMNAAVARAGICSFLLPPEQILPQIALLSRGKII